jgi:hypothetical protein
MGNGAINTCCRKDDKDEIEFTSKEFNNSNYKDNYLYEKNINIKTGQKITKRKFIFQINKIGNILNNDFSFFLPSKIKNYIKENPYEENFINSNISTNKSDKENINFSKPIQLKSNDIIYIGEWTKEGIINGKGRMYKPESKTYLEGEWSKGSFKYGRMINNENIYIGYFEDNLYNGKGKIKDFEGNIYEGTFSSGLKNGSGKYLYLDGCLYEGFYKNNEMNGYGIFKWNNDICYKGEFDKGIFNGKGILKWKNDDIYNGEFKKGFFHGKGIYYWKNENEYYKGEYLNNIKNGKGLYLFNNGDIFQGKWSNGKPNGKGTYETKNKIYTGKWKDGNLIEIIDVISKYQASEIKENINFNLKINKEVIDISNLEHINSKMILEIN